MNKKASSFFPTLSPLQAGIVLLTFFLFRLAFGLCTDVWYIDQLQTYLIGLKYYATGLWPYFGPDVAYKIQLPGALEGLVVGVPLKLCPQPEAPYILLNLLSFAGLCLFAWYCAKRLPSFPKWLIWTWLMTAPWLLNWSTNIDNDSYVLFGSLLFFTGFLETVPTLTIKIIPILPANFMMGIGLFWNAQFHMSYVILFPFLLVSLFFQLRSGPKKFVYSFFFFLLGCLVTGWTILPTLMKFGFLGGGGGIQNAVAFNFSNFSALFTVLARFLALASCELPRFIGPNTAARFGFLTQNPWLFPFYITAFALWIPQVLCLILLWFTKIHPQKDWPAVKWLTLSTFLLIYVSFLFAIKAPAAHTYYLTLPVAMLYSFYCFSPWISNRLFLKIAKLLLICNIIFHVGLAFDHLKSKSLYKNRGLFVKAIQEKNYHLLGERRSDTLY